jgi:histone acetyltransferase MYST1
MISSPVNRRLDEWVTIDRVDLNSRLDDHGNKIQTQCLTDLADGTDRKITRNQKRKHDEINHVQKVKGKGDGTANQPNQYNSQI